MLSCDRRSQFGAPDVSLYGRGWRVFYGVSLQTWAHPLESRPLWIYIRQPEAVGLAPSLPKGLARLRVASPKHCPGGSTPLSSTASIIDQWKFHPPLLF